MGSPQLSRRPLASVLGQQPLLTRQGCLQPHCSGVWPFWPFCPEMGGQCSSHRPCTGLQGRMEPSSPITREDKRAPIRLAPRVLPA